MNVIKVIDQQNGGANEFWPEDLDPNDPDQSDHDLEYIYQKRRSYVLGTISKAVYDVLVPKLDQLRNGSKVNGSSGNTRSGALLVKVFEPGEPIVFERTLLTTEDYYYPKINKAYSVEFSDDIISKCTDLTTYRIMAVDMIWCREDTLTERLNNIISKVSYSKYIYKVLQQIHPDMGISKLSMEIMDNFVHDMFDRIMVDASRLARYNKGNTISSREIQMAVRLLLPAELSKHAVSEGCKAVYKFSQ